MQTSRPDDNSGTVLDDLNVLESLRRVFALDSKVLESLSRCESSESLSVCEDKFELVASPFNSGLVTS